jgi:hypothetical protein
MEKRTRSAGTKLTEAEYERLERAAEARGLKLGEWMRQVLLEACEPASRAAQAVLKEVLALRTIVLNVAYELAAGERIDAERSENWKTGTGSILTMEARRCDDHGRAAHSARGRGRRPTPRHSAGE